MAEQFFESSGSHDKSQVNSTFADDRDAAMTSSMSSIDTTSFTHPPVASTGPNAVQKLSRRQAFVHQAKRAVGGHDAPTWGLDLKEIADGIEDTRSRSVIDLAMRVAEVTLSTGASAADVTANVLAVTRAYGLRSVHVDVTFTAIAVTHHRGASADPMTMVRTVRVRAADYDRLGRTYDLIADITDDQIPLDKARRRFEAIMDRPPTYRRGVITAASSLLGAGVALLLGATVVEMLLAALLVGVVERVLVWSARQQLAAFFGQMLGAAIPTVVAMSLVAASGVLPDFLADVRGSLIVSTGIVVLLAGLSVVGAAQDAIDGFYVTASARTFEVFVLTLGILVGVIGVITLASRLGTPSIVLNPAILSPFLSVQVVAVVLIAISYVVTSHAGLRIIGVSVPLAVGGWLVYALFTRVLEFDTVSSTGVACVVVGFCSQLSARKFKVPSLAISMAGIVAFLPGGMLFRGLYYTVEPAPILTPATDGTLLLLTAGATGLAIAGGVSLGAYLGWQVRGGDRQRARDRAKERALRTAGVAD
ncbi:MAG: threonine/serine exporter family protein [Mobilicoccus sp.]|nr:threonine/serine exporter family protein [Mobilicoccus sp.]